jgi:hypothetical protein
MTTVEPPKGAFFLGRKEKMKGKKRKGGGKKRKGKKKQKPLGGQRKLQVLALEHFVGSLRSRPDETAMGCGSSKLPPFLENELFEENKVRLEVRKDHSVTRGFRTG